MLRNHHPSFRLRLASFAISLLTGLTALATPLPAQDLPLGPTGGVSVPAFEMPSSDLMSAAGARSRIEHNMAERASKGLPVDTFNARVFGARLERAKTLYPVSIRSDRIAGVPVLIYEPRTGAAAGFKGKLLINVHGGGFAGCFVECGGLESIPVAALSGIPVISIDYREGPGAQFPQASEDVAAVYRSLLRTTSARSIGLFGCSAGGVLAGQALAWFQRNGLPTPAAAGIFCAGAERARGDSGVIGAILGDGEVPRIVDPSRPGPLGYMRTAAATDPLAYPASDAATLARFPPTLIVVGSRDFLLSGAISLHQKLVAQNVDARLHVWESGRHAFFYDPDVPESVEAQRIISKFLSSRISDDR